MLLGILYWRNRAGPAEIFIGLESWLVRTWWLCICILCFWRLVPCLTRFFFGAFISVPDLLDMLRCGCTFFIPVSNGCFCTLICKRYAVMEESLIKRIALSIEEKTWQQRMITCDRKWSFQFATVQIFVLLLLIIYSPDCIYLDSADELFLGLFLLFHKLRECFFLMVNCVSRNPENSFLYSINDQYILSYMYFASLIIGRHKWWLMKSNVEEIKNAFVGVY